jgi:HPt (histidine-containing phosphotransfer) domain-containing protein
MDFKQLKLESRAIPARDNGPAEDRRRRARPDGGTKPIDLHYLSRFTLGNAAFEREILDLFVAHTPVYLDNLSAAATAKAWHDAAHTLKGAARGIGAWRVGRTAEIAERLRFDIDHDRRHFALDSAREALDEAIGFIRARYRPQ